MAKENLNFSFDIPLSELERKIEEKLNGDFQDYGRVIPLRELKDVLNICLMREGVFEALIKSIPLRGYGNSTMIYPYRNSEIRVFSREPKGFEIGQTFILDRKLLGLMAAFGERGIFSGFITKGLSKMPPIQVYGVDCNGKKAIAFYIPPIVEIQGRNAVLIDGIHRSYICNAAGTTINAVHINDVTSPLPFSPINWNDARVVSEKPPKIQRYRNLDTSYFRDLTAVGIDG